MKTHILLLLFICSLTFLKAQQQFSCYHVQEFLWNSKTLAYDTPVEKSEMTIFKIDAEKKQLTQLFHDETSSVSTIKSEFFDKDKNIQVYTVISPSNGYTYIYRANFNVNTMEVLLKKDSAEILLKKHLFKD